MLYGVGMVESLEGRTPLGVLHEEGQGGLWQLSQFSSVTQSCPTLCDPMNHSTPGLPVYHQLSEFTQTHAH